MNFYTTGKVILGVPLRPWAGMAPARLAFQGLIHTAIGIFATYWCIRIAAGSLTTDTAEAAKIADTIRLLAIPGTLLFILFTLYGVLRLAVGVLDFVPRHEVTGVVVTSGSRHFGDFLPGFVQELIWRRGRNRHDSWQEDSRRRRHQVVLDTADGIKTFTVTPGAALSLQQGKHVRLSVSPLLGYVATYQVI